MKLSFDNMILEVNIFHVMKQSQDEFECYKIYMIDTLIYTKVNVEDKSKFLKYLFLNHKFKPFLFPNRSKIVSVTCYIGYWIR